MWNEEEERRRERLPEPSGPVSSLLCLFVGVLASGKWLGCELPTWKTLNPRYGWAPFPSIRNSMICHAFASIALCISQQMRCGHVFHPLTV